MTGVGSSHYDDPVFFERYQKMRQRRAGLLAAHGGHDGIVQAG